MFGDRLKRILVYGTSRVVFWSGLRNLLLNALLGTREVYYGMSIDIARPSKTRIGEGVFIGRGCSLKAPVLLKNGVNLASNVLVDDFENKCGSLVLEENVSVNFGCVFDASGEIVVEKNSAISPCSMIYTHNHNYEKKSRLIRSQGIAIKNVRVGEDCWIGARALILPGANIGKGCVVAAGSIVNKPTKPYSVVAGVPAKVVKWRT